MYGELDDKNVKFENSQSIKLDLNSDNVRTWMLSFKFHLIFDMIFKIH